MYMVDRHEGSSYNWLLTGGTIVSGNGTNRIVVNWGNEPGTFKVAVTERNLFGCIGEAQNGYVMVKGPLFKTRFPDKACLYDTVTLQASGGLWYKWSNGQTDSTISFKILYDTLMNVIISDTVCSFRSDTFSLFIKSVKKPDVAITSDADVVFKNQWIHLSYGGAVDDKLSWYLDKSVFTGRNSHGIDVTFNDTGTAMVKLVSVNYLGCKDSAYKQIEVRDEQLFFPTAFTPNRDGLNDQFLPGGTGIKLYQLNILNRWGQIIFSSNQQDMGWDGTVNGEAVQSDTYIYQCDVTGYSGKKYAYNGTFTLIR